jgi:hypothetical protein
LNTSDEGNLHCMSLYGIDLVRGGAYTTRILLDWKRKILVSMIKKHWREKIVNEFDFKVARRKEVVSYYRRPPRELPKEEQKERTKENIQTKRYILRLANNQYLIEGEKSLN